jgi:hypothetical protein
MANQKPRRPNTKVRQAIRPIKPEMDIQGVILRNDKYLDTMHGLELLLPSVASKETAAEASDLVSEIITLLEQVPRNIGTMNAFDKRTATLTARLILILQKPYSNVSDPSVKKQLKTYLDSLKVMGGDLSVHREQPRNMKEVLARNFLGLQPQDVRAKGIASTYMRETMKDFKVLFGGTREKSAFDKTMEDEKAIKNAEEKKQQRLKDIDDKTENEDKQKQKADTDKEKAHSEAIKEDKEREEKKSVHEEALEEDTNRNEAMKQGVPTILDAIAEKDAIHAQAIEKENEIEEATLTARENQTKKDDQKRQNQNDQEQKEKDEIEAKSDDTVTSEILEEVKAIHELIEKGGGVGGGDGTGSGKGKRKQSIEDVGEVDGGREETIKKMMKAIPGFKREDAEKAYDKGVIQKEDQEDKVEAEKDAHAEDRERSMARGKAERVQKEQEEARIEELQNAHAEALDIDENNKGRIHSTGIAQDRANETDRYRSMDKEKAHGEANAWAVMRTPGRIEDKDLSHDVANTMEAKNESQRKINEARKLDKGSAEAEAHLTERWRNLPKDASHEEALAQEAKMNPVATPVTASVAEPTPLEMPEAPEVPEEGGSWLGKAFGAVSGAVGKAVAPVAAGVAVGAGALGLGIHEWNKHSEAGQMTRDVEAKDKERGTQAYQLAQSKGFNSIKEMRASGQDKLQGRTVGGIGQKEVQAPHTTYTPRAHRRGGVMAGGVLGAEKGGIDEGITEKPVHVAPIAPIIYAPPAPAAQQQQRQERQSVFIRPVHPSFMRYQEKRLSRILFPQNTV